MSDLAYTALLLVAAPSIVLVLLTIIFFILTVLNSIKDSWLYLREK